MIQEISQHLKMPFQPEDIPHLISFWRFDRSGTVFTACQGKPYELKSQTGPLEVISDPSIPWGGTALKLREGDWLAIPREECLDLDIHGLSGQLSLVAWIRRKKTAMKHCEFIAGQWNESSCGRQYGLFLNISVWGFQDRVFGHISNTGGPTPGYKYCMDGSTGATEVPLDDWCVVGMSYDGQAGHSWFNGRLDVFPSLNPYPFAGGLHDGGANGSDFTVGAVDRSGEMGNFFHGDLAALAVYKRALSPAEMLALARR